MTATEARGRGVDSDSPEFRSGGPGATPGDRSLLVAPCSQDAARYAVERWHYSGRMPAGKLVKYGVWESGRFVGAVLYGRGSSPKMYLDKGLPQTECCELVRVAMREHAHYVSQVIADTLRQLRATNPGLRLVISFADPMHGHHGGIYQASNWIYLGMTAGDRYWIIFGRVMHPRSVGAKGWKQSTDWIQRNVDPRARHFPTEPKHRYAYPLDKQTRRRFAKLAQPYPDPA